jgi:hypothetical protein
MSASAATYARASEVNDFVAANWPTLKNFVPPAYSALPWDKYAEAAYTPMLSGAATGLFFSFALLGAALLHLRCAAILSSVGNELYIATANANASTGSGASSRAAGTSAGVFGRQPAAGELEPVDGEGSSATGRPLMVGGKMGYGTAADTAYGSSSDTPRSSAAYSMLSPSSMGSTPMAAGAGGADASPPSVDAAAFEAELAKRVRYPSGGEFLRTLRSDVRDMWHLHRWCWAVVLVLLVIVLSALTPSMVLLQERAACGVLAREPASATYVITATSEIAGAVAVTNNYPYGSIDVQATEVPGYGLDIGNVSRRPPSPSVVVASTCLRSQPIVPLQLLTIPLAPPIHLRCLQITFVVTVWAATAADLPSFADVNASLSTGGYVPPIVPTGDDDDGHPGGYSAIQFALQPPSGASDKCLGARVVVFAQERYLSFSLTSDSVLVNFTGNLPELGGYSTTAAVAVTTNTAPVSIVNAWVDPPGVDPSLPGSPAFLRILSQSGDLFILSSVAAGITAATSGTIRSSNVASTSLSCFDFATSTPGICGDVTYAASGNGRISVSQLFGAYNAYLSTEHGIIVGANSGVISGVVMRVTSQDGKIYLNNFLQTSGNETFVSTDADISVSAMFANKAYINAGPSGKVSVVESFFGCASVGALLKPQINFTLPGLQINTDRGAISILGIGGNPSSEAFSDIVSLDLLSATGSIKVEVNGGGINAPYALSSDRGSVIVELDGVQADATGKVGTGGGGNNHIYMHSEGGNVQMSVLASPL